MIVRWAVSAIVLAIVTAGCGGGATTASAPTASGSGTTYMTLSIPARPPSSAGRRPQYVSVWTQSWAIYDGPTLVWVANFTATGGNAFPHDVYRPTSGPTTISGTGACSQHYGGYDCSFAVTANVGSHTFGAVTYNTAQTPNGTAPPVFTGKIISEGDVAMNMALGNNNPTTQLVLNGVAWSIVFRNTPLPTLVVGQTTTVSYAVQDAGGFNGIYTGSSAIAQPGAYDNGPVTITPVPSGIVTLTPNPVSNATPPPATGAGAPNDQTFMVQCNAPGTVTFQATANGAPDTSYPFGLTYGAGNYPAGGAGNLGGASMTCTT